MSGRVALATLGCRLNQVDTQQIQAGLEARGFTVVPAEAPADAVVVNTCTVTARAEFSDRQAIRRARRANPAARVVVTGCWAQTSPGEVASLGGVDLVVGNADKERLPELVAALLSDRPAVSRLSVTDVAGARFVPPPLPTRPTDRSRAFVKVQDGCQHRCAFCIVPFARGGSRSLAPAAVLEHVRRRVELGHPEVVLTGIDLGHYGADLRPRATLAGLVRALGRVDGLRWLRLSSLLPAYVTDELLDALRSSPVVAPHFHVPLQSGSDRVLRAMRRPYTVAMYRRVVDGLAAAFPRLGLGADVLVGFPGETDEDFAATAALVAELPFTYLHVFPYSARRGTEAAARAGRVDATTLTRRAAVMRGLGEAKAAAFRRSLGGRVEEVLVLERRARVGGDLVGLTGHYAEVRFAGPDALMRRLARVKITEADGARLHGRLEEERAA
ncbi:MAG TPA: tRNA (N(6)-L-threonylcarbamoyladenosine(37)-C(2))-methylthiotransferase MtaB [Methylomirabilota bacterium]